MVTSNERSVYIFWISEQLHNMKVLRRSTEGREENPSSNAISTNPVLCALTSIFLIANWWL